MNYYEKVESSLFSLFMEDQVSSCNSFTSSFIPSSISFILFMLHVVDICWLPINSASGYNDHFLVTVSHSQFKTTLFPAKYKPVRTWHFPDHNHCYRHREDDKDDWAEEKESLPVIWANKFTIFFESRLGFLL